MNLKNKKIVIYTPALNEKIGGVVVLHNLAKELMELGFNAMLYVKEGKKYENVFCNKFASMEDIDDDTIVVYPEIVEGNPLKAKHVVRWILCDLGKNCSWDIYKSWDKNDLIFHYSTFNFENNDKSIKVLYSVWMNPVVKNKNSAKREGSCYLFKKASRFHKDIKLIHPKDSILIDNCSMEEIVDIFNQKEFFYCYDPYSFFDSIAALCGCIPIVCPIEGVNKLDWLKTRAMFHAFRKSKTNIAGVAYGIDDIDYARKTLPDAWKERMEIINYGRETIKNFINISNEYFFTSEKKSNSYTLEKTIKTLGWDKKKELTEGCEIDYLFHLKNARKELDKKNTRIKKLEKDLEKKEAQLVSVVSTLRWKIPNFFYKLYFEKIKKYIPRPIFIARNKLLIDFPKFIIHKIRTSTPARIFKKYYHLAMMAFEEYRVNGWKDLKFSIKRHWKKRKGTLIVPYAASNDFRKNLVSIGILTINRLDLIEPCIESIEKNLSQKYEVEILIGDTGSTEKEVWDFYKKAQKKYKNIKIIKFKGYFFSKNYNDLIRRLAKGEFLILLNNDTIAKKNWIDNFVDPLKDKRIGIVGGKLLYKNETIQHAGVEFNKNRNGIHVFSGKNKSISEVSYKAIVPSVTFAAVAMRHDVFNRFKLSEDFKEEAQDTDLCFRLDEAGFKVLYNPEAEIYHLENSTRNWQKGESDRKIFDKRWGWKIDYYLNKENQRESFDENYYKDAIVVIRDDGIGDLLMGVSAFHSLRKKYPDKKLVLLTYERNVEMMNGFKIFDEVLPIPNGQKYAPLPIPTKDTTVFNLINIEMNFGKARATTKEANKIPRHASFTQALELSDEFELVKIPNYSEAKNNVLNTLTEIGIDHQKNDFVVFNLSSTNPARSWWGPYYPSLIKAVEKLGFTPLIVGTEESPYFQGEKIVNLVGKTKNIQEYIEAIKLGKYVISTDTSAYHIAALAEIPFLAIFTGGVTPESRLSFYSKYEYLEPKGLSCYPCWDEGCKDPNLYWKKDPCRLIIKPEQAIEKFKELIKKY